MGFSTTRTEEVKIVELKGFEENDIKCEESSRVGGESDLTVSQKILAYLHALFL